MTVWNQWLRQPQSILLRRIFFQVHLWMGIALGLYIVVISLSGSLLVYRRELAAAASTVYVTPQARRLTQDELSAILQRTYPSFTLEDISTPRARGRTIPNQAIEVELRRGREVIGRFFNPYTGADLGSSNRRVLSFILWLADLHDDLLGDRTGRVVNGVGAIAATLLALTGAILWWPGVQNWRRGLLFNWKRKRYGFHWSLHNAVGFWMLLFVLLWGISGIYFSFPKPFNAIVDFFEPFTEPTGHARVGDTILSWLAQLHFGRFSGLTVKAIWTVLGLAPAVLALTGGLMWWHRVVLREPRRIEQPELPASPARKPQTSTSLGDKSSEPL
jgi:uncharacterized iron-regulated membrane protein